MLATLQGLVQALSQEVEGIGAEQGKGAESLAGFKTSLDGFILQLTELRVWKDTLGSIADLKTDLAVLRRDVDEQRKWQDDSEKKVDTWVQRLWMILPPVIGVIAGYLLGARK